MALQGSSVLHMVNVMGEHKNCKVLECLLIGNPPVLLSSGRESIVTHVILGRQVQLMSTAVLSPAEYLEAVTKIKTVNSLCGVLS